MGGICVFGFEIGFIGTPEIAGLPSPSGVLDKLKVSSNPCQIYVSELFRADHHYNQHRSHSALGGLTSPQRLNNILGLDRRGTIPCSMPVKAL